MADITQDYLKSILRYNKTTGLFTWRKRPREHFATKRGWNIFNAMYAGKKAGSTGVDSYWIIKIDGKQYRAHRLAWFYVYGSWPKNEIDHTNGNTADNRWINIREATRFENAQNCGARRDNTSGYKGVSWHKITQKWQGEIRSQHKRIYLGLFDSPEKAHEAYCAAAKKYHGKFSKVA